MSSAIDATKPVAGSPTTQSVRDNFTAAKAEILDLQLVRSIRLASVNESAELFQPCSVNNTPQVIQLNQVTYVNPADLSALEFDSINNELIYKTTGWYHVDISVHVVRKTAGATVDWNLHTQVKVPSGSFTNVLAGLRTTTLDGSVANQRQFFALSLIYPVTVANTRVRLMQTCTDVTKNCGVIGYAAAAPLPSAAGVTWSTHRIGPL